jgi:hypothetical protein
MVLLKIEVSLIYMVDAGVHDRQVVLSKHGLELLGFHQHFGAEVSF